LSSGARVDMTADHRSARACTASTNTRHAPTTATAAMASASLPIRIHEASPKRRRGSPRHRGTADGSRPRADPRPPSCGARGRKQPPMTPTDWSRSWMASRSSERPPPRSSSRRRSTPTGDVLVVVPFAATVRILVVSVALRPGAAPSSPPGLHQASMRSPGEAISSESVGAAHTTRTESRRRPIFGAGRLNVTTHFRRDDMVAAPCCTTSA
jgi:hypothetical protein